MPSNPPLSDEEIYQQVGNIIQEFKLLECAECAEAIKQWLKDNGINGIHLQLKLIGKGNFIVSQRWDEWRTPITQNGTHYGIEVRNKVFDNLSTTGLSRNEWMEDFDCPSGQFSVEVIEIF
ncbi:papain fold toxin domain-containing protein [Aerosakkonema funiforme]|uniref:Tox-PL-2 domain-containing protein n=1 Tax=Aerosakkonema funiforme FACHB-1375 TaxID=2949571 RepID=A0A926VH88_9CYAN|nr:papain fold toxin domain-containing protein [Aerosakkonema funiforme]MBD2183871.1 hypothetical protein [Aerosakkonema funiforme FACHB-1375]